MFTEEQKARLVQIARGSIAHQVAGAPPPTLGAEEFPDASGVFVTIKRRGELRGCLGVIQLRGSLLEELCRCARDSASEDPRFAAISADELPEISVDISILGPLEEIDPDDADVVVIGTHGLVVEQGWHRGLLLPQVAVEWSWTREQFLGQTCRKAGLAYDAWKNGARVYRFTAIVFGD